MDYFNSLLRWIIIFACFVFQANNYAYAADTDPKFSISKTPAAFDRTKNVFFSYINLKNITSKTIKGPFAINIMDSSIPVVNGKPYQSGTKTNYFFQLGGDVTPGNTLTLRVDFKPEKIPLTYQLRVDFSEQLMTLPSTQKISNFSISPTLIYIGSNNEIMFEVDSRNLTPAPKYFIAAKLDDAGNELTWKYLQDTGTEGDISANDGIFRSVSPASVALDVTSPHKERFKIKAAYLVGRRYTQDLQSYRAYDDWRYLDGDIRELYVEKPAFYNTDGSEEVALFNNQSLAVKNEIVFSVDENLSSEEAYALAEQIAADHQAAIVGYVPRPAIFTMRLPNNDYFDQSVMGPILGDARIKSAVPNYILQPFAANDLENMRADINDQAKQYVVAPYKTMKMFEAWDWLDKNQGNLNKDKVGIGIIDVVDPEHQEIKGKVKNTTNLQKPNGEKPDHGTSAAGLIGSSFNGPSSGEISGYLKELPPIQLNSLPGPINGVLSGVRSSQGAELIDFNIVADFKFRHLLHPEDKNLGVISFSKAAQTMSDLIHKGRLDVINMSYGIYHEQAQGCGIEYDLGSLNIGLYRDYYKQRKKLCESKIPDYDFKYLNNFYQETFDYFPDILFVVSSGNGFVSAEYVTPASVQAENKITVGSLNRDENSRSRFSNFGNIVDILAPGEFIYVPYLSKIEANTLDDTYSFENGTSYSAPFVTGTAGLLAAIAPSAKSLPSGPNRGSALKNAILDSASAITYKPIDTESCNIVNGTEKCVRAKVLDACAPLATAMHQNNIDAIVKDGTVTALYDHYLAISANRKVHIYDTNLDKIIATISDPVNTSDDTQFGHAVSLDNQHVLIGSPGNNRAYLYNISPGQPTVYDKSLLQNHQYSPTVNFGRSVALDGGKVYVGGISRERFRCGSYSGCGSNSPVWWEFTDRMIMYNMEDYNDFHQSFITQYNDYSTTGIGLDWPINIDYQFGRIIRNGVMFSSNPSGSAVISLNGKLNLTPSQQTSESMSFITYANDKVIVYDPSLKKNSVYNSATGNKVVLQDNNGIIIDISDWGKPVDSHGNLAAFSKDGMLSIHDLSTGSLVKRYSGETAILGKDFVIIGNKILYFCT